MSSFAKDDTTVSWYLGALVRREPVRAVDVYVSKLRDHLVGNAAKHAFDAKTPLFQAVWAAGSAWFRRAWHAIGVIRAFRLAARQHYDFRPLLDGTRLHRYVAAPDIR